MTTNNIVFLAEDDIDDLEMLVEAMTQYDTTIEFIIANTGGKAMEILKNHPENKKISLIILDYNLPGLSGPEILAYLRNLNQFKKTPKVVWSTSNSMVYHKKSLEFGACSYFSKPAGIVGIRNLAKELVELYCR